MARQAGLSVLALSDVWQKLMLRSWSNALVNR